MQIYKGVYNMWKSLQWRHNGQDGVSNHQSHHCLLNRLFRCRSKKKSMLHVTGLCVGNSPVTGEFPAQKASNAENVSIWGPWCYGAGFEFNIRLDDEEPFCSQLGTIRGRVWHLWTESWLIYAGFTPCLAQKHLYTITSQAAISKSCLVNLLRLSDTYMCQ